MVTIEQAIKDLQKVDFDREDICTTRGEVIILLDALKDLRNSKERIVKRIETEILENLSDCGDDWFTAEQVNKAIEIVKAELN